MQKNIHCFHFKLITCTYVLKINTLIFCKCKLAAESTVPYCAALCLTANVNAVLEARAAYDGPILSYEAITRI